MMHVVQIAVWSRGRSQDKTLEGLQSCMHGPIPKLPLPSIASAQKTATIKPCWHKQSAPTAVPRASHACLFEAS